ncbi:hypothetical protein M2352_003063 [Azospirillum fermentarium]|nr:hypothetical protein [Azospirillum fermentarium]
MVRPSPVAARLAADPSTLYGAASVAEVPR